MSSSSVRFKCARSALLMRIGVVTPIVIVSSRHRSIFPTPQSDCTPQGIWHQPPSPTLVPAERNSLVEIHIRLRITHRQGIRPVIQNNVLEFGNVHHILFCPSNRKAKMGVLAGSCNQVRVFLLYKRNYHGWHFHIIKKDGILTARHCFNRQFKIIKIRHLLTLHFP